MINEKYTKVSDDVKYIGCDDLDLDLFEGQYDLPEGMAYNSYLILDAKVCAMDTIDPRKSEEWMEKLLTALAGRTLDYLVVQHCEPDHASNVVAALEKFPNCTVVCSDKAKTYLSQFNDYNFEGRVQVVKEGDTLSLGKHQLHFIAAPMVHWPEVLMTYDSTDKILFSADGFGKFGALEYETDDWTCEARRYYFNICGKYGAQVQAVLKKAAGLEINVIAPLHGPVLNENLGFYIEKYDIWSKYEPETKGVFIAHCSLHGNTAKAAEMLAEKLEAKGVKVAVNNLCRDDQAEGIEDAFRYDRMILCAPTYDGGIMPKMEDFLAHLKAKGYKNRKVALVENGTWAPMAAKLMSAKLAEMKDITLAETVVTIRSTVKAETIAQLDKLAEEMA